MKTLHNLFSLHGRISRKEFIIWVQVVYLVGLLFAWGLGFLLFGTWALPIPPFMQAPDPVHKALFAVVPLNLCAPLFIKRQHDRNRPPLLFMLYLGLSIGFALFGDTTVSSTHPITQAELEAFVARNVMQAPIALVGLWIIVECCFFKGTEGENRFGDDPLKVKVRASDND